MKSILAIRASLILWGLSMVPAASGATGGAILAEIQSRYQKTDDLEAHFVQENIGKVMKLAQKGEGKVYFKKKGMMRWDYRVPNQKMISNGHTLWYYQPEENQVLIYDLSKMSREKTPWAFLAGDGNLSRDFNLVDSSESNAQKEGYFIVELTPKEPYPALARLVLTVDKKTYYVVQADVFDELGNVTRTRFNEIRTNVGLSNGLFNFTIPPGAEVLKFQGPPNPSSGGKGTPSKTPSK